MQDVNLYAKRNGGAEELGQVSRVSLKLDEHHFVSIVCDKQTIRASITPAEAAEVSAQ